MVGDVGVASVTKRVVHRHRPGPTPLAILPGDWGAQGSLFPLATVRKVHHQMRQPLLIPLVAACLAFSAGAFVVHGQSASVIEGYGVATTGGAGGSLCVVSTSAESGTGSFDSCVARGGNQTIIFSVPLAKVPTTEYLKSNTTIDGCANGQNGVTLDQPADTKRGVVIEGPVSNIFIRCLRFQGTGLKPGFITEFDLLGLDGTGGAISRVVVDHSTFSGATDGALDITGNVSDVTVQWNLFYDNPMTMLVKYGTRQRISLHHNV